MLPDSEPLRDPIEASDKNPALHVSACACGIAGDDCRPIVMARQDPDSLHSRDCVRPGVSRGCLVGPLAGFVVGLTTGGGMCLLRDCDWWSGVPRELTAMDFVYVASSSSLPSWASGPCGMAEGVAVPQRNGMLAKGTCGAYHLPMCPQGFPPQAFGLRTVGLTGAACEAGETKDSGTSVTAATANVREAVRDLKRNVSPVWSGLDFVRQNHPVCLRRGNQAIFDVHLVAFVGPDRRPRAGCPADVDPLRRARRPTAPAQVPFTGWPCRRLRARVPGLCRLAAIDPST